LASLIIAASSRHRGNTPGTELEGYPKTNRARLQAYG
jgi:hypothetical protein